jgi:carboxyl-terminal processing protease
VVITVVNVHAGSPAEAAGVLPGDHIVYVGKGSDAIKIQDVGYTRAMDLLAGKENTECSFTVYRFPRDAAEEGTPEVLEITAIRKKIIIPSVTFTHYSEDDHVGVIRMTGFNNTTCDQFIEAVETLKAEGCTSFVLDLRDNPGGLLSAVEDVLILFLQKDDVIITTKDAAGKETVSKVVVRMDGVLNTGSGRLREEDIGKYRDLNFSVLVNEYSASAAELFTSNIRDYELGTIVGTTTYGKGTMQTIVPLPDGSGISLSYRMYNPPYSDNYEGIGVIPDIELELAEELREKNFYRITHDEDNQLQTAVKILRGELTVEQAKAGE